MQVSNNVRTLHNGRTRWPHEVWRLEASWRRLLECPLTTRIAKLHDSNDTRLPFGKGSGYLEDTETD